LAEESLDEINRGVAKERNIKYAPSGRVLPTGIIYNKKENSYQVEMSVNGKTETAIFAITKYGEEEAFRLAEESLDESKEAAAKERNIRYAPSGRVLPTEIIYDKKDNSYRVGISVNGNTETATYNITKYGEEEAFQLAEERLNKLKEAVVKDLSRYAPSERVLPTGINYDKQSNS